VLWREQSSVGVSEVGGGAGSVRGESGGGGKDPPVLPLTGHRSMKAYWGSEVIAPRIPNSAVDGGDSSALPPG
jgi:hypothetical protein